MERNTFNRAITELRNLIKAGLLNLTAIKMMEHYKIKIVN